MNWYQYDQRLAFDGLRTVAAGTAVDLTGNAFGLVDVSQAIKNLGKYGRDKSELLLITSLREEDKLRQILGINLALNQLGLTGTALPGEMGKIWGVPVVSTLLLLETYTNNEASAVGGTYSNGLMLNRNAAIIGDRRIYKRSWLLEIVTKTNSLNCGDILYKRTIRSQARKGRFNDYNEGILKG